MDHAGGGEPPPERTHGLTLETCYRHPKVATGVHCTRCGRPICTDCMRPAAVGYQCPDCLAEAARDAGRSGRPRVRVVLGRPGIVTTTLLAANIAMFVVELVRSGGRVSLWSGFSGQTLVDLGALYSPAVAGGHQYWRLITVMFLHASLLHILFNMYALYLFGYLIENAFGKVRYLAIYFVSGFLASVASYLFLAPGVPAVGASGAIFGLLGAWVAFNFRRRGTPLASMMLRNAFFIIAINLFLGFSIAGIDNSAHIGGLIAGVGAGVVAEGFGPPERRGTITIAGFAAMAALGILLAAYRTSVLT